MKTLTLTINDVGIPTLEINNLSSLELMGAIKYISMLSDDYVKGLFNDCFLKENNFNTSDSIFKKSLDNVGLTVRACNTLRSLNVCTVGDLIKLNRAALVKYENCGNKSLIEIDEFLSNNGLCFNDNLNTKLKL